MCVNLCGNLLKLINIHTFFLIWLNITKLLNFRLMAALTFLSNGPETEEREEGMAWGNYKSLPRNETGTVINSGPKQVTHDWM